jgi:hypothetical protein
MKRRSYVCRNERFRGFSGCGESPLLYGYHVVRNLPLGDFILVMERQQLICGGDAAFHGGRLPAALARQLTAARFRFSVVSR